MRPAVIGLGFKARQPASSTRHEERPKSVVSSADRPIRDALLKITARRPFMLNWQPGSALEWVPAYEGVAHAAKLQARLNETVAEIRR
jgi:hypothetical protein